MDEQAVRMCRRLHVARRLPWKILRVQCGRHVRVAKVIVNNNPQTMKRSRRSFCTAAGWCVAPALMLRSAGASTAQMRCDASRSMRANPIARSSSFETRARAFKFAEPFSTRALLRMRTSSAYRRTFHINSPSRSRGALLRPGLATLLHRPRTRGGGAPRVVRVRRHPLGVHITRHARRLRGALRPMTRDARLSALHRGGFSPGAALPSPA